MSDLTDCAVLYLSCDRYSDLWLPSTQLFNRHWPDCPWPRYFASDSKPRNLFNFTCLGGSSPHLDWSTLLGDVLKQLPYKTVLLFLDDFFLTSRADTTRAKLLLDEMHRLGGSHLRLVAHRNHLLQMKNSELVGELKVGLPYRTSLQAGFWRVDTLAGLLRGGESPWEFEVAGTWRSESIESPFLAAWENPVPYIDVLERGKWLPRGLKLCRREGVSIDLRSRRTISYSARIRRILMRVRARAVECLPVGMRIQLRKRRRPW